jgi:hypothetical protein
VADLEHMPFLPPAACDWNISGRAGDVRARKLRETLTTKRAPSRPAAVHPSIVTAQTENRPYRS